MARSVFRDILIGLAFAAGSVYIVKALIFRTILPEMSSLGNPVLMENAGAVLQLYYADHQEWPDCSPDELVDILHGNDPQFPPTPEQAATFVKRVRKPGDLDGVDYFRETRDRIVRSDDGHQFHDAWAYPIEFKRLPDGTCELRSAGEDHVMHNADDAVVIVRPVGRRMFPPVSEFRQEESSRRRRLMEQKVDATDTPDSPAADAPPPEPDAKSP